MASRSCCTGAGTPPGACVASWPDGGPQVYDGVPVAVMEYLDHLYEVAAGLALAPALLAAAAIKGGKPAGQLAAVQTMTCTTRVRALICMCGARGSSVGGN